MIAKNINIPEKSKSGLMQFRASTSANNCVIALTCMQHGKSSENEEKLQSSLAQILLKNFKFSVSQVQEYNHCIPSSNCFPDLVTIE